MCQRLTPDRGASQAGRAWTKRDRDSHPPFEVLTLPAPGSGGGQDGGGVSVFWDSLGLKVIEPLRSNTGAKEGAAFNAERGI